MSGRALLLAAFVILVLLMAAVLCAVGRPGLSASVTGGARASPLLAASLVALGGGRARAGAQSRPAKEGRPGAKLAAVLATPPRNLRTLDEDGLVGVARNHLPLLLERPDAALVLKIHPGDSATSSVVVRDGLFDFLNSEEQKAMETPAAADAVPVLLCTAESSHLTSWLAVLVRPGEAAGSRVVSVPGGFP